MPRRNRCIVPGLPCHVTQRGVNRCETFSSVQDRQAYLRLVRENMQDAHTRILGWCVMTNHVHLVAIPERDDSLAILLRRVHGRYAQYYNTHFGRTGHLWQSRFFACVLGPEHLWTALAYVDRNPLRAGMVRDAADYRWSSAAAHLSGVDGDGLLDTGWWREMGRGVDWATALEDENQESTAALRNCTYAGRPYGSESLVRELAKRFGRCWTRGRPTKEGAREAVVGEPTVQVARS